MVDTKIISIQLNKEYPKLYRWQDDPQNGES